MVFKFGNKVSRRIRITKLYNHKQAILHASRIAKFEPNWVIVGGKSGPGARPILQEWVTDIRDQCLGAKVPFFFKQWGGVQKTRSGQGEHLKVAPGMRCLSIWRARKFLNTKNTKYTKV